MTVELCVRLNPCAAESGCATRYCASAPKRRRLSVHPSVRDLLQFLEPRQRDLRRHCLPLELDDEFLFHLRVGSLL